MSKPCLDTYLLHEWVYWHAQASPERPSIATSAARLTYGQLAERVRSLAANLAAGGIQPGDRVMLALPNTAATVVAALAINAAGAVSVEVSHTWSAEVLAGIITRSRVRQAFIWGRDARTWGVVLADHPLERVWVVPRSPSEARLPALLKDIPASLLLEDGRVASGLEASPGPAMADIRPDQPALILYTSGSTGVPHGVIQTFRNIDANSRSIVEYLGLTSDDRALITLPLFYCYGRSVLQTHLLVGGSVFLENRTAFPRVVMETIAAEGCTGFAGVPLTFEIIRRQVDVSSITFPRLRYLTQAGGPMAPDTIAWVRKAFAPARLFVMYGQTEATARLSYLPPERATEKAGSIGIPIPGVELRVMDERGRELPDGETGELVARGDNVTPGYLDEPEETAAILHDGWLWTGDLAVRDADGFFYHRGRAKEILKIGGHRVSPIAIEHVVGGHPDVAEAAVCGIPDDLMGELPVAFVVPAPGKTADEADLRRHCRERLPAVQVPVEFIPVESLPRNSFGKLLRGELSTLRHATAAGEPRGVVDPPVDGA